MYHRPTNMAMAFVNMAAAAENKHKALSKPTVDHWVPRRVAMLADNPRFAMVTERDHMPPKPVLRKALTAPEIKGIEAGMLDLVETTHLERNKCCAYIEDGEGSID